MLENVDRPLELGEDDKKHYKVLIDRLILLQQQARSQDVGMVVLFEGWEGAGKGSRLSDLLYNLDARGTKVYTTPDFDEAEASLFASLDSQVTSFFPLMKPFWDALSIKGDISFFARGWYSAALRYLSLQKPAAEGVVGKETSALRDELEFHKLTQSIKNFERQLIDDGYVVLKFFIHISQEAQRMRIEGLRSTPETAWRISDEKYERALHYEEYYPLYDAALEQSDFDFCPWVLVNGENAQQANLVIAENMVEALEKKLSQTSAETTATSPLPLPSSSSSSSLPSSSPQQQKSPSFRLVKHPPQIALIKNDQHLDKEEYHQKLEKEQQRLFVQQQKLFQKRIPLMIVYEGWDAAGKGGNIKRVAQALDARSYTIFPSGAPEKTELLHPFLWRYWTRLPKAGHVGIYDRSWYGRVLVERVEGFATTSEWTRAFDEINEFEYDLLQWGAILLKFWVNVSPDEQLVRFHERGSDPQKYWKLTDEDWRNREKYPAYQKAIDDMFRLTSTKRAPWVVLESDNKYYARIKALKTINKALEKRLALLTS